MIPDKVNTFEVEFGKCCPNCIHFEKSSNEMPCMECLEIPMRYGTRKPTDFELDPDKAQDFSIV